MIMTQVSRKKIISQSSSGVNSSIQNALNEKLSKASNLSDVSNTLMSRNNLKMYDMFITTGDVITTSSTPSDITDLVTITLEINKRYYFDGVIRIGCNNTGGVKIQATIPTGATVDISVFGNSSSSTLFLRNVIQASATLGSAFNTLNSTGGILFIKGEVQMGSTAGTVQFGFASGVNLQTSTVYKLGTNVQYKQID